MRSGNIAALFAAGLLFGLGGCQQTLYDWGSYDASVQRLYFNSDKAVAKDAPKLAGEIQRTLDAGRAVPPGKAAHTGYLFYLAGDHASARKYFRLESDLYPESSRMVDHMIARL